MALSIAVESTYSVRGAMPTLIIAHPSLHASSSRFTSAGPLHESIIVIRIIME